MFCEYYGIKLSGNENFICSTGEEIKEESKNNELFYYSGRKAKRVNSNKPFIKRLVGGLLVATVLSYGASFAFDLITAAL